MLDQLLALLAPLAADLRTVAVDRVIGALIDANKEALTRLERIEAKVDVLKNKDAATGRQYLKQALESHRTPAGARAQLSLALDAFVNAASSAADDAMSRSIARVNQAVCWACLGSDEDVRRRLGEAVADAYEATYQVALQYNEPHRTAAASGQSRVQRYRKGLAVVDRKVLVKQASGKTVTPLERIWGSTASPSALRLQTRMEPWLDLANAWARSVTSLYKLWQKPDQQQDRCGTECRVSSSVHVKALRAALWGPPPEQASPRRAHLEVGLRVGTVIDVGGLVISFADAAPRTVAGTEYLDVFLKVDAAEHAGRERSGRSNPGLWCVLNQAPSLPEGEKTPYDPVWRPRDLDGLPQPWLKSDTSKLAHGGGFRLGAGHRFEVAGWRRFPRHAVAGTVHLLLVPCGPLWPLANPREPRPRIAVLLDETLPR